MQRLAVCWRVVIKRALTDAHTHADYHIVTVRLLIGAVPARASMAYLARTRKSEDRTLHGIRCDACGSTVHLHLGQRKHAH